MAELGVAARVLDLGLLRKRVADARPEVLFGRLGDDLRVDEDVARARRVVVVRERATVVVDHGDGGRGGAVGADRGEREHRLVRQVGRDLAGVDGLAPAHGEDDVGLLHGGLGEQAVGVGLGAFGAVDEAAEDLNPGTLERGADERLGGAQGALAADEDDLVHVLGRADGGDFPIGIGADGVVAHFDRGGHAASSSMDVRLAV